LEDHLHLGFHLGEFGLEQVLVHLQHTRSRGRATFSR
jgi:hypothetical protein